jgi:hypothetical protein
MSIETKKQFEFCDTRVAGDSASISRTAHALATERSTRTKEDQS